MCSKENGPFPSPSFLLLHFPNGQNTNVQRRIWAVLGLKKKGRKQNLEVNAGYFENKVKILQDNCQKESPINEGSSGTGSFDRDFL